VTVVRAVSGLPFPSLHAVEKCHPSRLASADPGAVVVQTASSSPVSADSGTKKLWGGRFTGKTDPLMERFNESLPFDKRMWAEDIRVRRSFGEDCHCHDTSDIISKHVDTYLQPS
jgi:hypothetical protein